MTNQINYPEIALPQVTEKHQNHQTPKLMKNRKKNHKNKSGIRANDLPQSGEGLAKKAEAFLNAKSDVFSPATQRAFKYTFARFVEQCGDKPIAEVTSEDLRQFVHDPARTARERYQRLAAMKTFLKWCSSQGYISEQFLSAAHSIRVEIPGTDPHILTPDQLKKLLSGTRDVERLVSIALLAFSGIRLSELERLSREAIRPPEGIRISPEVGRVGRAIPILPTLDAWLRPFYGTKGLVVSSRNIAARIHKLACELKLIIPRYAFRHSYCAYRLALVRDAGQIAIEAGCPLLFFTRLLGTPVSSEDAKKFFSLTPDEVGIKDWPKLVAKHLK